MSKKAKLKLEDIKVQSFVTNLEKESQKEVKAGLSTTINYTWCGGPWFCDDSILWHICTGHACPNEEPVPGDETPEQP